MTTDAGNIIIKELGQRIRELRKIAGLTQEALDEKTGLNYKYIGELERGRVNVSIGSLVKIAEALGVRVGDFFTKEKIPEQKAAEKVYGKEKNPLLKFSKKDLKTIRKAFRLIDKILLEE
ncbi:MAG: helix-turn-helix transcriptional regulator [Deltaproteobacteria bacterium]